LTNEEIIERRGRENARVQLATALLRKEPILRDLLAKVALKRGLLINDVLPKSRLAEICETMGEFYFTALRDTVASTVLLGNVTARDHTTVLYGAARYAVKNDLEMPRRAKSRRYAKYLEQKGQTNGAQV
jgi:hypothetical protein